MCLILYVDDIVVENDATKVSQLKKHLCNHFQIEDLRYLKSFMGIEIDQSKQGIVISQRKYALDIVKGTSMIHCRPMDSPMVPYEKLMAE